MGIQSLKAPKHVGCGRRSGRTSTEARLAVMQAALSLVAEAVEATRVMHLTEAAADLLARYPDSGMTIVEIEAEVIQQVRLARIAVLISN